MKTLVLADNVAANGTVAQTALSSFNKTPFLAGRTCVAAIDPSGVTGTPTIKVQGSVDNSTWVDLLTSTSLGRKEAVVTLYPYMRANQTVAGTAGVYTASLLAE